MKSFGKIVIAACVALLAAAALAVYARHDERPAGGEGPAASQASDGGGSAGGQEQPKSPPPAALPGKPASAAPLPASADDAGAAYDITSLPPLVQRMLQKIIVAAQSGTLEAMRPVMQSNEIVPLVSKEVVPDPIAFLKSQSVDGSGRDVLAAMLNVFASGFAKSGSGRGQIYIWPYLATRDLTKLRPEEQVDLYRIVPPEQAAAMIRSGKYSGYRAGIGPDGVWHYFLR